MMDRDSKKEIALVCIINYLITESKAQTLAFYSFNLFPLGLTVSCSTILGVAICDGLTVCSAIP